MHTGPAPTNVSGTLVRGYSSRRPVVLAGSAIASSAIFETGQKGHRHIVMSGAAGTMRAMAMGWLHIVQRGGAVIRSFIP